MKRDKFTKIPNCIVRCVEKKKLHEQSELLKSTYLLRFKLRD
jgi:hypothetical protein